MPEVCICGRPADHYTDDEVTFQDGCRFTNRWCPIAGVWADTTFLDHDQHEHVFPPGWPARCEAV